jgi:hypothetical protein
MHAYGPAAWYGGVHCFSGEIEQSSLDSAEGRSTEKDSYGDKTRKPPVVRKSVAYVTVNVLSVPRFPVVRKSVAYVTVNVLSVPRFPVPRFPVPRFPSDCSLECHIIRTEVRQIISKTTRLGLREEAFSEERQSCLQGRDSHIATTLNERSVM